MACAAVLRTYGDMSVTDSLMASIIIGTIIDTRMLERTRNALARISWLGSCKYTHCIPYVWPTQLCSSKSKSSKPDFNLQICAYSNADLDLSKDLNDFFLYCCRHPVTVYLWFTTKLQVKNGHIFSTCTWYEKAILLCACAENQIWNC